MESRARILVYGYGNPGLQDDGLGNAFVERVQQWASGKNCGHIHFDSNYQLNIEDADNIAGYDVVLFADASQEEINDVLLTRVMPDARAEFSMHAVSPAFVLDLCEKLYQDPPAAYLLHIRGYSWDLHEGLTEAAGRNLEKAVTLITPMLLDKNLFEVHTESQIVKP